MISMFVCMFPFGQEGGDTELSISFYFIYFVVCKKTKRNKMVRIIMLQLLCVAIVSASPDILDDLLVSYFHSHPSRLHFCN